MWGGIQCQDDFHVGDMDGDGKADLVCHVKATGDTLVWLSNGLDGYVGPTTWDSSWLCDKTGQPSSWPTSMATANPTRRF